MQTRHRGAFLLPAFAAAVILFGCGGADTEKIPSTSRPGALTAGTTPAGLNVCMTCHTEAGAEWSRSAHANLESSPSYTTGAACTPCHDPLGDSQQLSPVRMVVGCESCHGPGLNHANAGGAGAIGRLASVASSTTIGAVTISPQFRTCTSCHELLDSTGTGTATANTPPWHSAGMKITDTHFATPGQWASSYSANTATITGYSMNFASDTVCTDCHHPHKNPSIHKAWVLSAHADATPAGAWAHYNWSAASRGSCQRCHTNTGFAEFAKALEQRDAAKIESLQSGSVPPVASQSAFKPEMVTCTGCHKDNRGTLRNPGAYRADYSIVSGGAVISSAVHQYPDSAASNVCLPCHVGRQSGDTVKNYVLTGPTVTTFGNIGFQNPHYLPAGGILFGAAGYEFDRSYVDTGSFQHKLIGTLDGTGKQRFPGTGSSGPCVGCHMYREADAPNHLFSAVFHDQAGAVSGVSSEVCFNCHAGSSASLAASAEAERSAFHAALQALIVQLDKRGISFTEGYPYMMQQRYSAGKATVAALSTIVTGTGTLWTSGTTTPQVGDHFRTEMDGELYPIASVDSDTQLTLASPYSGPSKAEAAYVVATNSAAKNWLAGGTENDGRNNMGAALNLQLLEHEPGAYIHNRTYTKRLIYDSIDWLDNKKMDYSVGMTLNRLDTQTTYRTAAMAYILPYGVRSGVDLERP